MTLAQIHEQKGRQQGRQESQLAVAQNMLRKGLNPALVAETTGIDLRTAEEMVTTATHSEEI